MTNDRWQEILTQIKDSFEVEEEGTYENEEHGGTTTEFIVFNGPLGRLRLEFSSHPVLVDTKTKYSKRIGSETKVEYVYSSTEKSNTLLIYKYDEALGDWVEFKNNLFT